MVEICQTGPQCWTERATDGMTDRPADQGCDFKGFTVYHHEKY